jgi:hypothetical protein
VGEFAHICKLINSVWNKDDLPEDWKESIIVLFCKKGSNIVCSNYSGISRLSTVYTILSSFLLSRFTPYAKKYVVDFDVTDQLLTIYYAFIQYLRKKMGIQ